MSARAGGVIRPGDADAELASRAARRIRDYLAAHLGTDPVRIRGELAGGDALIVPQAATVMFAQIRALLANGQGVQIIPDAAELTTQQAADFLTVSRPYLTACWRQARFLTVRSVPTAGSSSRIFMGTGGEMTWSDARPRTNSLGRVRSWGCTDRWPSSWSTTPTCSIPTRCETC